MIDCHAHIGAKEFDDIRDVLVKEAKDAGVIGVIVVPEYYSGFEKTLRICEEYSGFLIPSLGLHPIQGSYAVPEESLAASKAHFDEAEAFIEKHINDIVCIGETGLDFTPKFIRKPTDKEDQLASFRAHIELAKKYQIPLNIHSRSAGPQIFKLLDEYEYYNCLFHAYG